MARQKRGGLVRIETGAAGERPGDLAAIDMRARPRPLARVRRDGRRGISDGGWKPSEDDALRQVALWKMDGYTVDEIAGRLGCARRTVARRLDLIRRTWLAEEPT